MNQSTPWLLALFVALFAVVWFVVLNLIARFGGWTRLAAAYSCREPFQGYQKRFSSGTLLGGMFLGMPCDYNGCLTVGANGDGLYLALLPPFRPGHPPLFVPWSEVRASVEKSWLRTCTVFSFDQVPSIRLRLLHRLAQEIVEKAGAAATLHLNDDSGHAT
jgi:hypothetical protein